MRKWFLLCDGCGGQMASSTKEDPAPPNGSLFISAFRLYEQGVATAPSLAAKEFCSKACARSVTIKDLEALIDASGAPEDPQ